MKLELNLSLMLLIILQFYNMLKLKENLVKLEVKDNSNIIMRVGSEKNVVVTDILFAKTEFLENIKNYYEGDIYVRNKNYLIFYFLK